MTPSQIYWVLQLDSIVAGCIILAVLTAVLCVVMTIITCANDFDSLIAPLLAAFNMLLMVTFIIAASFIPSTKTAAAMYVIPRVVNNEVIQADMLEIYKLGMDKVKSVLDNVPAPVPEKKK